LDDSLYIEEISNLLPKWVAEGQKELCVWEWTKFNMRNHAIQFSKKRARSRKDQEAQLEKNMPLLNRYMNMVLVKTT